jgi:hypothetical protein
VGGLRPRLQLAPRLRFLRKRIGLVADAWCPHLKMRLRLRHTSSMIEQYSVVNHGVTNEITMKLRFAALTLSLTA